MKEHLLDILREPNTNSELELSVSEGRDGEIWEGTLRSVSTGKEYAIRSGIPRFIENDNYTESFGLQWNRFAKVQLDSANGARYSHQRFEHEVGWSRSQLNNQWVLDGGCGCGRFAEVAAELGAKVIALDYSSAVDAAAINLYAHPNVHFIQGDLIHPPFKPKSLKYTYSIGVLQHTSDSHTALASLLGLLQPGGRFAVTCYGRRWYTRYYSKYVVRFLTRHMPPSKLLKAVEILMPILFPMTSALFRPPVLGKLAQFMIPVANYVHKSDFSHEQRYQEAILDTFDMLSPTFDTPMKASQVLSVLNSMSIKDYAFRSIVPINITGTLPLV